MVLLLLLLLGPFRPGQASCLIIPWNELGNARSHWDARCAQCFICPFLRGMFERKSSFEFQELQCPDVVRPAWDARATLARPVLLCQNARDVYPALPRPHVP